MRSAMRAASQLPGKGPLLWIWPLYLHVNQKSDDDDETQFHMVKGIINAFDHMEFCLVINLTMGGNRAVTWPPIIVTRNVSFANTLNTM